MEVESDGISVKEEDSFEILPYFNAGDDFSFDVEYNIPNVSSSSLKEIEFRPSNVPCDETDSTYEFCEMEQQVTAFDMPCSPPVMFDKKTITDAVEEDENIMDAIKNEVEVEILSCESDKFQFESTFSQLTSYAAIIRNPVISDVIIPFQTQTKLKSSERLKIPISSDYSFSVENNVSDRCANSPDEMQVMCQRVLFHEVNDSFKNKHYSGFPRDEPVVISEFQGLVFDAERRKNGRTVEIFPRRTRTCKKFCEVVSQSLGLCKWFHRNKLVRNLLEKAKSSFDSFVNVFEMEMNNISSVEEPLILTIVADEKSCRVIEEAFTQIFRCQINTSTVNLNLTSIPVLAVGLAAGLQSAEDKIQHVRRYGFIQQNSVIVSTSRLLYQAVEPRWQMTTVICLDDPKLQLSLHNFTLTTPIPNEYVMEAKRRTPETYPLRESGFSVNIEQVVDCLSETESSDTQEFLTGFSSPSSLKSAALILAGMYQKYTTGFM